jgi:formylglycine-generating enzyme required for sulfatase activity
MEIMKAKGRRIVIATGVVAFIVLCFAAYLEWPHIVFRYRFESLGLNAQGFPEYRHRQTGMIFVRLPGGTFWMGAQKEDPKGRNYDPDVPWPALEGPVHEAKLSSFLIAKYELTQAQWKAVMGSNPSRAGRGDDLPVENLSWDDIQQFEAKTGLWLPTETQWEYACRAMTATPFAGTGKLEDMGWCRESKAGVPTHPVGTKAPNRFGLHDMHGNVEEVCEDNFDPNFYRTPESSEKDPLSVTGDGSAYRGDERHVFRGGRWDSLAWECRASIRRGVLLDERLGYYGCRMAAKWP